MDVGGAMKWMGGGYEIDRGGYEMDGGGAMKLIGGAHEIDEGAMKLIGEASNRLRTYGRYGDTPQHGTA